MPDVKATGTKIYAKPVILVNSAGEYVSLTGSGDAALSEQVTQTAHLAAIETAVEILDNIVSGNEAQVDVLSTVLPVVSGTSAVTSVADTATSTTLLSSSAARKGFRIQNTSSAALYIKYGTTASASDFTVRLTQWGYLEEDGYHGRVDGIWATDPGDGAALITSLSA